MVAGGIGVKFYQGEMQGYVHRYRDRQWIWSREEGLEGVVGGLRDLCDFVPVGVPIFHNPLIDGQLLVVSRIPCQKTSKGA